MCVYNSCRPTVTEGDLIGRINVGTSEIVGELTYSK